MAFSEYDSQNGSVYATPADLRDVTRTDIIRCIDSRYRNQRITGYALMGFLAPMFIGLSFVKTLVLYMVPAAIMFIGIGLFLVTDAKKKTKKLMALKFTVETDVCCIKREIIDKEDNSVKGYAIVFEKHGEYKPVFGNYLLGRFNSQNMYNMANYGQSWYVVLLEGEKRVQMAFPAWVFNLDKNEFTDSNGVYVPVQNTTGSQLVQADIDAERRNLNTYSSGNLTEFAKTMKSVKTALIVSAVGTVLCTVLLVIGCFIRPLNAVNLVLLFVIAALTNVPAIIAVRKSAVACRKIDKNYSMYVESNEHQSFGALLSVVLLFANFVICMANMVIYVKNI